MSASPAAIIRQALLDTGVVRLPVNGATTWPIYISFLPDAEDTPSNAVAIYDTSTFKDGRLMLGKVIEHPGIMFHVRAQRYIDGYDQAKAITARLDAIKARMVVIDSSEAYVVAAVTRLGGITPMGREPSGAGTKRRELFSINATCTIYEAAP